MALLRCKETYHTGQDRALPELMVMVIGARMEGGVTQMVASADMEAETKVALMAAVVRVETEMADTMVAAALAED